MADRIGQQLGNYRLTRLLGQGGFAEVYLGKHVHLDTLAAIKVLHTQLGSDDVEKFRTEARMIARLIHPHIVRVLDFGVEGKTPFLVMDNAPNGNLRQRHPKGVVLPLPTIISYVKQVADALQYAHNEKLIHRDIKPENILVGQRNEALLSDFGIALVAQSSRYQNTQEMAGTIAYMAPEQIQGKPRSLSDQYALGVIVYEWLSGDRPFHGSFTEIVAQHLAVPPPPLHEKVPVISPNVEHVVMTALAKDPHQRFTNVQGFATALEEAVQVAPIRRVVPSLEHPLLQTHAPITLKSSQLSQPANITSPSNLVPPPSNVITPSDSSTSPTSTAKLFSAPTVSPIRPHQPRRRFSLLVVEKSLIGLVLFLGILVLLGMFYEGFINGVIGALVTLLVGLGVLAGPLILYLILLLYRKLIRPLGKS